MTHTRPKQNRIAPAVLRCLASLSIMTACIQYPPPANLAPDPRLVDRIREIRITATPMSVCPGAAIQASYVAVLDDGTLVPFERTYSSKHPPKLHVNFLELSSKEATSDDDANWVSDQNPIKSATSGIRLNAALKAKPVVQGTATVAPKYDCAHHAFDFTGATGAVAQTGEYGPPVTVRIGMGRSPYYDELLVVGIQVGANAPFYELYDAKTLPPAGWLAVATSGGSGGTGTAGSKGANGLPSPAGCPSVEGGPGGDGGNGSPGGPGGRGGRVTVVVPAEEPRLAELVAARSPGGPGGFGGAGGAGGHGGSGAGSGGCPLPDGEVGRRGQPGPLGPSGLGGPPPEIVTVPADQLFGPASPSEVIALIASAQRRP
jgi:hypothetical protein